MDENLIDLYNIAILDQSDMTKIRLYVNSEYAFASKNDKLTMFSNELNKLVDKNLDGLCYSLKVKVKKKLIFEFVSGYVSRISLGKALDEILLIGTSAELTTLENWFAKSTNIDFYDPHIRYRLKEKIMNSDTSLAKNDLHNSTLIKNQSKLFLTKIKNLNLPKLINFDFEFLPFIRSKFKLINIKAISISALIILFSIFAFNTIKKASYSSYELDFYSLSSIVEIDKVKYLNIITDIIDEDYVAESFGIPKYFEYREINSEKLLIYLNNRNSLLAEDNRYKTIMDVAKESNLNPLLLFAIVGQEQGFVNKDNPHSELIINNPFNVYTSWLDYNTNINDSTQIAANTIILRLQNRPKGLDPFLWINSSYAEDDRWWIGVKSLYYLLENRVGE
ncbi:MAG: hypothetical protein WBA54_02670 [Acidaminobacteraceae bacterium]